MISFVFFYINKVVFIIFDQNHIVSTDKFKTLNVSNILSSSTHTSKKLSLDITSFFSRPVQLLACRDLHSMFQMYNFLCFQLLLNMSLEFLKLHILFTAIVSYKSFNILLQVFLKYLFMLYIQCLPTCLHVQHVILGYVQI